VDIRFSKRTHRVGLTLIELVVVLGILAILTTLVLPRFSAKKATVESVSKEALSLFQLAQQESYASYTERRVSFDRTLLAVTKISMETYATDGTSEILSVELPDSSFIATLSKTIDAIIFSPTQDIRSLIGLDAHSLSKPFKLFFVASEAQSRNITIYPKTKRLELN
jgi:type II secretory pathway pseudopilin PulG